MRYVLSFLVITSTLKIFEIKDMMGPVTCVVHGMDYKLFFLKDCPYTYYVHCMTHRLQLALVTASREVKDVHQFFDHLVLLLVLVSVMMNCNMLKQNKLRI